MITFEEVPHKDFLDVKDVKKFKKKTSHLKDVGQYRPEEM